MKINAIALKDFTRYDATTVGFDDTINIIVAENAAGKTSIVDAITYCLTGACDRTDKAGRGAEAMIRTGAKEAGIGLQISVIGQREVQPVSRRIPGGLKVDGHEGGQKELQEYLYEIIGASDGATTSALNTHAFLDLTTQEQKSLLFGLLGLELTPGAIESMIVAEAVKITSRDGTIKLLEAAPRNLYQGGPGEIFANLYKHFYELRRNFKRDLKALGEQPPLSLVPDTPDKDHLLGEVEGLEQLLYEVKSQRDKAAEVEARGGKLEAEITKLRGQLETAADTKAAQEELETVRGELSKLMRESDTAEGKAEGLRGACKALKTGECLGVVKCPLTKPKRQALIDDLVEQIAELDKQASAAADVADLLRPREAELRIMSTAPDHATLEGMIAERQKELGSLPEPVNTASAKAEITDLQDRIVEKRAALEEIVKAQWAQATTERQAAERARLTDEVEVLEVLVELTGPKGIPGRLLYETLGPLQTLANDRLAQLTGGRYFLHFEVDPDFKIIVTHDDVESDLKRLSSSEKMRIGIILQDAVSRLSGLRVMIVDDADKLDPHNRMLLTDTLLAIKDDYDTILVLSTVGTAGVTDPGLEDVAVYQIINGEIERVREEAMVR